MDAAARGRSAERRLVARPMDVDVAVEGVHAAAAIDRGFQAFEPEDAVRNRRIRQTAPGVADHFAAFEHSARGPATANFLRDAVQTGRSAIRIFPGAHAETRGRDTKC